MYDLLCDLGVAMERVKYEYFGPAKVLRPVGKIVSPPRKSDENMVHGNEPCLVTFSKSGLSARWDPNSPNLLEFAEEQGLMPNFSCRSGTCESCKTQVLSGKTEYVVTPFEEPTDGTILLCCSQPIGDVTLDL
jgi:ferredoxin